VSDGTDICWFRRDLRVADQPALVGDGGAPTVSVFVVDPRPLATAGRRRRVLLARHLLALDARLRDAGGDLLVLEGDPVSVIPRLAGDLGARTVRWNGDVSGYARRRDADVRDRLTAAGTGVEVHWGTLVHEPGSVVARSTGVVQRVFTPFSRAWAATERAPWPEGPPSLVPAADGRGRRPDAVLGVDADDEGDLLPAGGELAAEQRLGAWLAEVDDYEARRDLPADDTGTSHLSSDLRFGTLSPRHVVDVVGTSTPGRAAFVRQLAWRDWYAHLLAERPELAHAAMKPGLDDVAWRDDPDGFEAWRTGRTGYPIVDAGMRQLAATGWMHNRVRMIAASFLVKDLLIDWRLGEAHFRRELIDAEVSQNAGNWQWVAGTGPDAAPYFRIFNPVTQSRRFDPGGGYLRRWVPELRGLDDRSIHAPWELAPLDLAAAGVHLGDEYPWPIVDHAEARERTLAAYGAAADR
jgi:deoxyribodipyrimidine photo-lyase